jgi:hypothetical protein
MKCSTGLDWKTFFQLGVYVVIAKDDDQLGKVIPGDLDLGYGLLVILKEQISTRRKVMLSLRP